MVPAVVLLTGLSVPWPTQSSSETLQARLPPPDGYARVDTSSTSFTGWLRRLPVKAGRPDVRLHNGSKKGNQTAHWLVLDIDVGRRNLQQCADAVMRLFAEWQWSRGAEDDICFRYTSGHKVDWQGWSRGLRPRVRGRKVRLRKAAAANASYASFRRYLNAIYMYAGSASLTRDLRRVRNPATLRPGDVFIQGGFPGHAVIVVDVVENARNERKFALAQSYMPAQEIHVLRNPNGRGAWYGIEPDRPLVTPEWTFKWTDLKRFRVSGCP